MEHSETDEGKDQQAVASGQISSSSKIISRMALNDNKAGMEGLDKERINQIIFEASKDSKFFENEKRKEEQLEVRIKEQQFKMSTVSQAQLLAAEQEADKALAILEDERDLSHTIVHVDMDAFYAAVEMRDDPTLLNKPMAVGGMGMLSTSNYLARRFGVRAAMPGFIGLKLCPDLVIVKPNFDKYSAVSKEIRQVLAYYDPDFLPMSLDEAYLDLKNHLHERTQSSPSSRMFILRQKNKLIGISGKEDSCRCDLNSVLKPTLVCSSIFQDHDRSDEMLQNFLNEESFSSELQVCEKCKKAFPKFKCRVFGLSVEDAVLELRSRIEQRTHLTASAGIAPNTMLAKVCSDKKKPNGQYLIKPDKKEIMNFIKDLPIRKISGIGKVTEKLLGSIGVVTCKDLFTHRAMLYHLFSNTSFQHFLRISLGISSSCLERDGERKSISTERTFSEISDPNELHLKCQELCESLSEDMKEERTLGKTVTLKIKTVEFEVKTRSYTLAYSTNDETVLHKAAQMLLQTEINTALPGLLRLRLMGIRMSKLCSEQGSQLSVADIFKRIDKKEQVQSSEEAPSSSSCECRNQAIHANFYDICTAKNSHLDLEDLDDEDGETFVFSKPLENTYGNEHSDIKMSKEKPALSLVKSKEASLSSDTGILKFVFKKDQNHDTTSQAKSKPQTETKNVEIAIRSLIGSTKRSEKSKSHNPGKVAEKLNYQIADFTHQINKNTSMPFSEGNVLIQENQMQNVLPCLEDSSNYKPESRMVSCPICKQQKLNWPLDQLNSHLDLCLSKQAVKSILQTDKHMDGKSAVPKEKSIKRPAPKRSSSVQDKKQKVQPSVTSYFKS